MSKPAIHPQAIRNIYFERTSRGLDYRPDGMEIYFSQPQALALAKKLAEEFGGFEVKEN